MDSSKRSLSQGFRGRLDRRRLAAMLCSSLLVFAVPALRARAQARPRLPTIGFLGATTPAVWKTFVEAFQQRLRGLGWIEGNNIAIEYRWAEGREERYAEFA